jgi:outer membrane protein OmpA-like peptidoglycan-associated protein
MPTMKVHVLPLLIALFTGVFPSFLRAQETIRLEKEFEEEIHFEFGKYRITTEYRKILDDLYEKSKEVNDYFIEVTAHTDSIGNVDNNMRLSTNRANAVKEYLAVKGIPPSRINAQVFGESAPVADNTTEEGRMKNRRAQVILYRRVVVEADEAEALVEEEVTEPEPEPVEEEMVEEEPEPVVEEEPEEILEEEPEPVLEEEPEEIVEAEPVIIIEEVRLEDSEPRPLEENITDVRVGEAFDLENLYFVGDQDQLLENSKPELEKLYRFMQLNPNIRIEIAGHINYQGELDPNTLDYRLAEFRARNVYDYLIQQGVQPWRLSYKGYGNSQMRFPEPRTEEEAEKNRRVEVKVIGFGKPD